MSTLKVDGIRSNSATSDAITLDGNGKCAVTSTTVTGTTITADTGKFTNLPNRNLIINGAMNVAQRGTSSTSQGYQTIDRWRIDQDSGLTEACTQSQESLAYAAAPSPWASGFRKAFRITNGNQTSQDANDYIQLVQKIEAQDLAKSGWNYTSSSSYITLSFWVKASIAQTFYVKIEATDAGYTYTFPIAVTTSWQRLTKTIPGNAQLIFNDDTGVGMRICIIPFYGTNYTTSGHSQNTWIASDGANQTPDYATTWFSGNDATFDVTGVQLEVSDYATSFEFRTYAQELQLCARYYQKVWYYTYTGSTGRNHLFYEQCQFHPQMRAAPSLVAGYDTTNANDFETRDGTTWRTGLPTLLTAQPYGASVKSNNDADYNFIKGILDFSAEL